MKRTLLITVALVGISSSLRIATAAEGSDNERGATGLVREVREGTADFRDVNAAIAAGYESTGTCVTGPEEGAMGVHLRNRALIADPSLDPQRPELLVYEQRGGRMRLVGVEFLVIAAAWDATNPSPPVLMGQHFQYVGSPNRYRIPPFYELHVWAWKNNVNGMFVDWNPAVSCEEYTAEEAGGSSSSGHTH